jgi:hypothetical protein
MNALISLLKRPKRRPCQVSSPAAMSARIFSITR